MKSQNRLQKHNIHKQLVKMIALKLGFPNDLYNVINFGLVAVALLFLFFFSDDIAGCRLRRHIVPSRA